LLTDYENIHHVKFSSNAVVEFLNNGSDK